MAVGRLPPAGRGPSQAFGLAWASSFIFSKITQPIYPLTEAQLCLPYICLYKKIAFSHPKVTYTPPLTSTYLT